MVAFVGIIDGALGRLAVFTQDGLVAAVGDILPDGTSLDNILRDSVSINNAGQIAFFGQTDGVVAIFNVESGRH
jgi:hypothetical protein